MRVMGNHLVNDAIFRTLIASSLTAAIILRVFVVPLHFLSCVSNVFFPFNINIFKEKYKMFFSEKVENKNKKRFLYGISLGGAVAINMHRKEPNYWNGAILMAPLCKVFIFYPEL
jgi:Serine aminopeptidase, S33